MGSPEDSGIRNLGKFGKLRNSEIGRNGAFRDSEDWRILGIRKTRRAVVREIGGFGRLVTSEIRNSGRRRQRKEKKKTKKEERGRINRKEEGRREQEENEVAKTNEVE